MKKGGFNLPLSRIMLIIFILLIIIIMWRILSDKLSVFKILGGA